MFVVTVVTSFWGGFPTSISAYHSGAARDVFVGTLVAIAACLVACQGRSPLEDFALNAAGFYVAFVALIPTELPDILKEAPLVASQTMPNMTLTQIQQDFVRYLQVAVGGLILTCLLVLVAEWRRGDIRVLWTSGDGPKALMVGSVVVLPVFLGLCFKQLYFDRPVVLDGLKVLSWHLPIHFMAAVLFIISLAVAVASRAWPGQAQEWAVVVPDLNRGVYKAIVAAMTLGALLVAAITYVVWPGHVILVLEWWEVALFIAFWVRDYLGSRALPDGG